MPDPHSPAALALAIIQAYLVGGLPFGYWFVRFTSGQDIRQLGSGNIGATNVYRTRGKSAGIIVLLLDVLKGWTALFIASRITSGSDIALAGALLAVLLGHCYPVFLGFRGGKAVACYVGAFLFLAPLILLLMTAVFGLTIALTRYVSLASILSAALFPFALLLIHPVPSLLLGSAFGSALVIYRHRANIARLRAGSESTFSLKGGKAS